MAFTTEPNQQNQHEAPEETLNYGASISTLVSLIEEGKL